MQKSYHAIERTSPKGPGQKFIGTCMRCGRTNLPASAALEECENVAGISNDEALIMAIKGPTTSEKQRNDTLAGQIIAQRERAEAAEARQDAQQTAISMLTDRAERAEADRDRLALELSQAKQLIERLTDAALSQDAPASPGPAGAVSEAEVAAALAEWSKPNERRAPAAIMRAALEAAQRARK